MLQEKLNVPASTTAMAFVRAAKTIGAKRVAIVATYSEDVAVLFKKFLEAFDIEVIQYTSKGIITAAEVGTMGRDDLIRLAAGNNHAHADALLIPDTALHSVAWLEELEEAAQIPVMTANQVSFWEAVRLTGQLRPQTGLGTLFARDSTVS